MADGARFEAEWRTRKNRIDPKLDELGWRRDGPGAAVRRTEEEPTDNGPADYALWTGPLVAGIVEAKKLTVGPQNVLTQAARYSKGLTQNPLNFNGYRVPFLYATNGEVVWFHDVRHPLNRSRQLSGFHSSVALQELLDQDFDGSCAKLAALPNNNERLRPYQRDANTAVEKAIANRKRSMLVAMATGTGKTFTLVNQIYRLMKADVAKRVLFLVDRRALAAQAVRAFSAFEAEPGQKFNQIYEVYSSRFQAGDFEEGEKFDPKILPSAYLTEPQPGHAFVYVCTIQRMAINLFGRQAVFDFGEEPPDDDAARLDIPLHAFDVIIADECHRGYTAQEQSTWRSTLEHFDAIRVGLTATPAAHTTSYFTNLVYKYDFNQAVRDGYLVDYDAVTIKSDMRINGVFLKEGEEVQAVDPLSGTQQLDLLEDERHFDAADLEQRVTAPDSNRKIMAEVKKYSDLHQEQYGRVPKTLIFAANDVPHTSHADQLVTICRDLWGGEEAFVSKITGKVDRPLQRIREFRNRPNPAIAVTVDLLSTGVDIPDLEFIVFLRPVKSRILFEQMLGRGTRKGERFTDKTHFTVFDCFDGSLLEYFKQATGITAEPPVKPTRTVGEIIEDIWQNQDKEYNIGCLVKRLQRIDKEMSAEAREMFAAFVPGGDVASYARGLTARLHSAFVEEMKLLRTKDFQELLQHYPRRPRDPFLIAHWAEDSVTSSMLIVDGLGQEHKPADYLEAFATYIRENRTEIAAIRILLDRPKDWSVGALNELRQKLAATPFRFTEENLQKAHTLRYHKAVVDIISMVKHAADEQQPLFSPAERVERAFQKITAWRRFTGDQEEWLARIRQHLLANLSVDQDDFDLVPALSREGGLGAARRAFGPVLEPLIQRLNEGIAA